MKNILATAILGLFVLAACNNDSETHENHMDSTSHTTTGTDSNHNMTSTGTTSSSGMSMMEMMNKNMKDMKAVPTTGNPDNDFAALMKIHHMGALEMAQVEVSQGTDAEVKKMAEKMIADQQREIAELNSFLTGHEARGGGDAFYKEVMAQMDKMKMEGGHSGSIDKQFIEMMIPHHQGAIDMAKAYLKGGAHEEKLKTMANNIITSQQSEIQAMQNWLNKNK